MRDLICIVDDNPSFRSATARMLKLHGYDVAEYASPGNFLDGLRGGADPSCAILDVRLPDLDGLALQLQLAKQGESFPIIFLTGDGDVPTAVKAIKAGAEDVLTRPVCERALNEAIARALANSQQERSARLWRKAALSLLASLTPREREVFDCVVLGKGNRQAAEELSITVRTIKAHRHRVFEKLHSKTVADLVSLAERLHLVSHSAFQPLTEPIDD